MSTRILIALTLEAGALACLPSCVNSVIYQPDRIVHDTPASIGLPFEPVTFQSQDGTRLSGWFVPAKDVIDPRAARGTVIHFHGNAENMTSHWHYVAWVVERGFNLFVFDYRGYGASAGEPNPKAVFEDSCAAIDHVRSRADVRADRLLVIGQSLGGTNAIVAVGSGDRAGVRAMVIESTFASYSSLANQKVLGAGLLMSDAYSADRFVTAIAPIPILFLHGTDDEVIPSSHSERLYELAREPKKLVLVPGGRHTEAFTSRFGDEYRDMVVRFFEAAIDVDCN